MVLLGSAARQARELRWVFIIWGRPPPTYLASILKLLKVEWARTCILLCVLANKSEGYAGVMLPSNCFRGTWCLPSIPIRELCFCPNLEKPPILILAADCWSFSDCSALKVSSNLISNPFVLIADSYFENVKSELKVLVGFIYLYKSMNSFSDS